MPVAYVWLCMAEDNTVRSVDGTVVCLYPRYSTHANRRTVCSACATRALVGRERDVRGIAGGMSRPLRSVWFVCRAYSLSQYVGQ